MPAAALLRGARGLRGLLGQLGRGEDLEKQASGLERLLLARVLLQDLFS